MELINGTTGEVIRRLNAFHAGFVGGVNVAVADMDHAVVIHAIVGAKQFFRNWTPQNAEIKWFSREIRILVPKRTEPSFY